MSHDDALDDHDPPDFRPAQVRRANVEWLCGLLVTLAGIGLLIAGIHVIGGIVAVAGALGTALADYDGPDIRVVEKVRGYRI